MDFKQQIMNVCYSEISFGAAAEQFPVPKLNIQYINGTKTIATLPGKDCNPKL